MNASEPKLKPGISITDILPLVELVVARMSRFLPAHVQTSDLISAGRLAVAEVAAVGSFVGTDEEARSFFERRVRGAVLDELRHLDPLSRYGRSMVKQVRRAAAELEIELGRVPLDSEIAKATGLTTKQVAAAEQLATTAAVVSLDAADVCGAISSMEDENATSPADSASTAEASEIVRGALSRLSSNQAHVLRRYYLENTSLDEIAAELGISTPRVHQLRVAGEKRLREDAAVLTVWRAMIDAAG